MDQMVQQNAGNSQEAAAAAEELAAQSEFLRKDAGELMALVPRNGAVAC
jgi:methyl-accepting chemotaxis protein